MDYLAQNTSYSNVQNSPVTVLIIDDDPLCLQIICKVLESIGWKLVCCSQSENAINYLIAHSPDVIIMDYSMPGLNGAELSKQIRSNTNYSSVPIIMLSSETKLSIKQKACYAGADFFLNKPVNKSELISLIQFQVNMKRFIECLSNYEHYLENQWLNKVQKLFNLISLMKKFDFPYLFELALEAEKSATKINEHLKNVGRISAVISRKLGFDMNYAENIRMASCLIAVSDVFDALISPKPYRQAYSNNAALKIIIQESGTHFDPDIVDIFLASKSEILDLTSG